jgi:hypothetical protein
MGLLSIGHILSGYKNTVHRMRWTVLQGAAVVKKWRYIQSHCFAFKILIFSFFKGKLAVPFLRRLVMLVGMISYCTRSFD